ncbi:MAG: hypothetical protein ACE5J4_02475 [Candidatus Aenigmatarchaeota archaeon]
MLLPNGPNISNIIEKQTKGKGELKIESIQEDKDSFIYNVYLNDKKLGTYFVEEYAIRWDGEIPDILSKSGSKRIILCCERDRYGHLRMRHDGNDHIDFP